MLLNHCSPLSQWTDYAVISASPKLVQYGIKCQSQLLVIHNTIYQCINQLAAIIEFKHLIPGAYILGQLHLNVCIYIYLFIYVSLTEISTLSDYWDKWPWVTCGLIRECILIKGLAGVPSVPILEACQNRNTFHVSCWYIIKFKCWGLLTVRFKTIYHLHSNKSTPRLIYII